MPRLGFILWLCLALVPFSAGAQDDLLSVAPGATPPSMDEGFPSVYIGQFVGDRTTSRRRRGCTTTEVLRFGMSVNSTTGAVDWIARVSKTRVCGEAHSTPTSCWYGGTGELRRIPHERVTHALHVRQTHASTTAPPVPSGMRRFRCGDVEVDLPAGRYPERRERCIRVRNTEAGAAPPAPPPSARCRAQVLRQPGGIELRGQGGGSFTMGTRPAFSVFRLSTVDEAHMISTPEEPPPRPGRPERLSRNQVHQVMTGLLPAIRGCAGSLHGTATVDISIRTDGRVGSASLDGGVYADTPTGLCIVSVIRGARFPEFRRGPMRFSYPFRIR